MLKVVSFRVGQVWRNRRSKPDSVFMIHYINYVQHKDGNQSVRIGGVLACGIDGEGTHQRELDSRSLARMFPYLHFDPPVRQDKDEGK